MNGNSLSILFVVVVMGIWTLICHIVWKMIERKANNRYKK